MADGCAVAVCSGFELVDKFHHQYANQVLGLVAWMFGVVVQAFGLVAWMFGVVVQAFGLVAQVQIY